MQFKTYTSTKLSLLDSMLPRFSLDIYHFDLFKAFNELKIAKGEAKNTH